MNIFNALPLKHCTNVDKLEKIIKFSTISLVVAAKVMIFKNV